MPARLIRNLNNAEWRHSKLFLLELRYRTDARTIEALYADALADGRGFNDGNRWPRYPRLVSVGSLDGGE